MYYVLLTASMYQRLTSLLRLSNHGHMPHALFPHYSPFQPFKKTLQTLLINQEGHLDPARCMVLLLQSRRIRFRALERDASWLHRFLPSKAEVRASSPAHPLPPKARMALLVVPVLDAQAAGKRQWCGYCLKVHAGRDLDLCTGCKQVRLYIKGYIERGYNKGLHKGLHKRGYIKGYIRVT